MYVPFQNFEGSYASPVVRILSSNLSRSLTSAASLVRPGRLGSRVGSSSGGSGCAVASAPAISRDRPFAAELLANQRITWGEGVRDVRHLEISLAGSELRYEPGDAIGVVPENPPQTVAAVLAAFHAAGLVTLHLAWLPAVLPVSFVAGCAFGALGLCFTAVLPTIDHMNLPVFVLVLPMGLLSSTYFPLEHPLLVAVNLANPLYHLAQGFRGLLLGGPVAAPLAGVAALSALMLVILVPLDVRLLRRRVLGE